MAWWQSGWASTTNPASGASVWVQCHRFHVQTSFRTGRDFNRMFALGWDVTFTMAADENGYGTLVSVLEAIEPTANNAGVRLTYTYDANFRITNVLKEESPDGGWSVGPAIYGGVAVVNQNEHTFPFLWDYKRPDPHFPTMAAPNANPNLTGDGPQVAANSQALGIAQYYNGHAVDEYRDHDVVVEWTGTDPDFADSITVKLAGAVYNFYRYVFTYRDIYVTGGTVKKVLDTVEFWVSMGNVNNNQPYLHDKIEWAYNDAGYPLGYRSIF